MSWYSAKARRMSGFACPKKLNCEIVDIVLSDEMDGYTAHVLMLTTFDTAFVGTKRSNGRVRFRGR